jgi:oxygen-independent coproporphyrinogen-3 oxidase
MAAPTAAQLRHAARNIPRYTSYPTALSFAPEVNAATAHRWIKHIDPTEVISAYVHVPYCRRLCWYCGCHTNIAHRYQRVESFFERLRREIELWALAAGEHAGLAHLHFGGGSPNALSPEHFTELARLLAVRFALRPGAEVAVELDPGLLSDAFADALGPAGVTRASLGVQTFDRDVQLKVNRLQPFEQVARAVGRLRGAGVRGLNFDLMYGLPGQTPENVAESARLAVDLKPDRVAVFGYAHVPWMKKHQMMIDPKELADGVGRWAQAEAADEVLTGAGYVRIGLDHYARPEDPLARASAAGTLRRNFQGYTDDPAPVLIPIGPSSIGQFAEGFVQNVVATDDWAEAVGDGRLPVARGVKITDDDRLRAAVIERLMCDLAVDVGAVCAQFEAPEDALDDAVKAAAALQADGLCVVSGRRIVVPERARLLMRVTAACFDARLADGTRHAKAV